MIDNCIAFYLKYEEEKAYKIYVSDALKVIAENTAKFGGGSTLTVRYYDIINPKKEEEERTAEDVISNIRAKIIMSN